MTDFYSNAVGFISFFMAFLMFRERLVFKSKGGKIVILVPYFHNYVKTKHWQCWRFLWSLQVFFTWQYFQLNYHETKHTISMLFCPDKYTVHNMYFVLPPQCFRLKTLCIMCWIPLILACIYYNFTCTINYLCTCLLVARKMTTELHSQEMTCSL